MAFTLTFKHFTGIAISKYINPDSIFSFLLPPIILSAGYNMRRKYFFENLTYISMFGFLGTVLSFFIVCTSFFYVNAYVFNWLGAENSVYKWNFLVAMKMAATLIATDTIAPLTLINEKKYPTLFSIVFGEGVSNDAVALILMATVLQLEENNDSKICLNLNLFFSPNRNIHCDALLDGVQFCLD